MTRTHFTAWLVNDPSALDQGCMDVTILEDEITGYREGEVGGEYNPQTGAVDIAQSEEPIWATAPGKPHAFYAVTTVDARDGDTKDGISEAEDLMGQAGWRVVGDWDTVDNAYIVTVERNA